MMGNPVRRQAFVHQDRARTERVGNAGDGRQRIVIHIDPLAGVFGKIAIRCHDAGNGIAVTGRDLRAACDALIAGTPIAAKQIPAIGCSIKWKPGNEPEYFGD